MLAMADLGIRKGGRLSGLGQDEGRPGGLLRFCVCSCYLWFAALPHGHRLLFGALLLAKISSSLSFTVLACNTSGSLGAEGSWLHANLVALRVLPMLQNGVAVLVILKV